MAWWAILADMAKKKAEKDKAEQDAKTDEAYSKIGQQGGMSLQSNNGGADSLKNAFEILSQDDEEAKKKAKEKNSFGSWFGGGKI